MIDIDKSSCCGCYACFNICPTQCITMKKDKEGFYYPSLNTEECTKCGLCERVCPALVSIYGENKKVYACKNKNKEERYNSSSGGLFSNLCKHVIRNNGVVFGAKFDDKFKVIHAYSETIEDCKQFRGSKYVQSEMLDNYKDAKLFLDKGKLVLFSGTQCQIKALNLFLAKDYKNLITVDVICHGVCSPLVFEKYINTMRNLYNSEIDSINFRDKCSGWKNFSYSMKFKNGKNYINNLQADLYIQGFLKNLYLRPSCHECRAKNFSSCSDISLADYWGVRSLDKKFDDDKGVSLVLINSEKGEKLFSKINKMIEIIDSDLNHAIKYNPCIVKSVYINKNREEFFERFDKCNDIISLIKEMLQNNENKIK